MKGSTEEIKGINLQKTKALGEKTFKGKRPCTICRITPTGLKAFENYVKALKSYLQVK